MTAANGGEAVRRSPGPRSQPDLFRQQALACGDLGSPMYADLFEHLADDLEAGGPTARVVRGHENDPGPSALALRLAGSIHRLVLAGDAAELAGFYPSAGGTWSSDHGVTAVIAFLADRGEEVSPLLDQAPQTNEVGRSAALLGGLLRLVDETPLPVRLFEIGSSGGLNLQADRFRYVQADADDPPHHAWGPEDSPVVLDPAWRGEPVPVSAQLEVVERGGSDVSPVDVTTDDGSLTLRSYVWPDQTARHERLAGAIELARTRPAYVERADAASYVERLRLEPGTLTVLWHSVMWQYVPEDQQAAVTARLEDLGATSSPDTRLAHLYAEPVRREPGDRHLFLVCAHTWPGDGGRHVLGVMEPHGPPVTWE